MIKNVQRRVWAFDMEWIPDPLAGRLLLDIGPEIEDPATIMQQMWEAGGATEEDPTPFLKTIRCRIVSVAAIERLERPGGEAVLRLMSLPHDPSDPIEASETHLVQTFVNALGEHRPQLVGYNSIGSDLKILVQRGLVLGVEAAGFCERPGKPWEGVDYFARGSDWNIDLQDMVGGWGKVIPSLHEIAVQSGIPGKMEVDGNQVAQLWLEGKLDEIIQYNEFDAITTYLVWLRLAHFAGHFSSDEYTVEQQRVWDLVSQLSETEERRHLAKYLEEWQRLGDLIAAYRE
ncbi:MAG: 3'-5' exonuclease [bacterium]|nr:3'-5' exonuclease [bacterium]